MCSISVRLCVQMCLHATEMCYALSSGSPSTYISLIHTYSSAPRDCFELPTITHFCMQESPLQGLWTHFSDKEDKQENQWLMTADTSLTACLYCASNTVSCLAITGFQHRLYWEFAQKFAFSLSCLILLMALLECVWERGGECRLGLQPDSPLCAMHHAKVLLIRLIKCFVSIGPTLHATNTSSSTTPTPPLHPVIFHMFP